MAFLGESEDHRSNAGPLEEHEHDLMATSQGAMDAPAADNHVGRHGSSDDGFVVVDSDGVECVTQGSWISGPQCEEVDHLERSRAPRPGKAGTTPHGGVEASRIGGRWIEHHEADPRARDVPDPGQSIAIASLRIKGRRAVPPRTAVRLDDHVMARLDQERIGARAPGLDVRAGSGARGRSRSHQGHRGRTRPHGDQPRAALGSAREALSAL